MLEAARTLREQLIIRYFMLNGLAPTELSLARLEGLDPVACTLFLPKRHWKKNCLTDIDAETVKLQVIYAGDRTEGPLLLGRTGEGLKYQRLWEIVKAVAMHTCIAGKEKVNPLILKRTFAKIWLKSGRKKDGGNLGSLQKQFSHKHLWSTAHYLRFFMDDVKEDHLNMIKRFESGIEGKPKRCPHCGQPILPKIKEVKVHG
jgi:integrase